MKKNTQTTTNSLHTKTAVKAAALTHNHAETAEGGLRVKTTIKAGIIAVL